MALSKDALANKKARRERKRKMIRAKQQEKDRILRISQKRMVENRREQLRKRQDDRQYIAELEAELDE